MIPRYTRPEMDAVWNEEAKFQSWLEVELAVCEALADIGQVPADAVEAIKQKASFTVERIEEIEKEVDHDLIAFVKCITEHMGDEAKYVHLGVTSYDIEDTALALRLRRSCDLILRDLEALEQALVERAREHKHTLMMGRTHGVHAEPITFGLKLAVWIEEVRRHRTRVQQTREVVSCGKISGAVGTYANIDPRVQPRVCEKLGLASAKASTQILQRDRHAQYLCTLALIAGSLEKFATEIRNLQRTDLLEVEEPFKKGQRGSSAMPHKRNPIKCEQITGLARVVRANAVVGLENITTWHERDLSNSSSERVTLVDSSVLVDYLLHRFIAVVRGMVVYPENMRENMDRTRGVFFSQHVMLALIDKGWSRERAYTKAQVHALKAWEEKGDFRALLEADPEVTGTLSPEELDACFDFSYPVRHVDRIFAEVGI